ncbi:hypothetical protein CWO90_15290 [Bradyrhizobium sp. Leo121]|nr:hypothetical protein CWO90_15290 [Bradyrhizobium sp. Leo121]
MQAENPRARNQRPKSAECKVRRLKGTSEMKWCARCDNCRWVCENHPAKPWLGEHACTCGGAGMPCPACNPSDEKTPPDLPEGFEAVSMTGSHMRRIPGEEIESSIEPREWSEPEPATFAPSTASRSIGAMVAALCMPVRAPTYIPASGCSGRFAGRMSRPTRLTRPRGKSSPARFAESSS